MMSEGVMTETFRLIMRHAERKQDVDLLGRLKRYAAEGDIEAWNMTEEDRGDGFETSHETNAHEDRLR